jgi:hypothetical protein
MDILKETLVVVPFLAEITNDIFFHDSTAQAGSLQNLPTIHECQ